MFIRWRKIYILCRVLYIFYIMYCKNNSFRFSNLLSINFCSARHVNRKYPWSRTEAVRDNVLVKQPAPGIYLFKVKNENTRRIYEICSKLRLKTPVWLHWSRWPHSVVFLSTFTRFHTLLWCFGCWHLRSKCWCHVKFLLPQIMVSCHNLPINNDSPRDYLPGNFDWGVIIHW